MLPLQEQFTATPTITTPSASDIDRISNVSQSVLRNLLITQCYYELSLTFSARTGICANWCTFATWASKQAGQTIRQEDFIRTLEELLRKEPEVETAVILVANIARQLGARQTFEQIKDSVFISMVLSVAEKAGRAVSAGNKKVFEEIAREFAIFMSTCYNDNYFDKKHIDEFCAHLIAGDPPGGQEYLKSAFNRYYESFFEADPQKRAELIFLANVEIGFHEQTRLQPEIADSLNAASIDVQEVKKRLMIILFPSKDYTGRIWYFLQRLFQGTNLLDKAIETLIYRVQHHLRRILTAHIMTLHLPPDNCLHLGSDLNTDFSPSLKELVNPDLLLLLKRIDPTNNSLTDTGAIDWSDLSERLHFIVDLFRCYQDSQVLFEPPFSNEQVHMLKSGRVPVGRL